MFTHRLALQIFFSVVTCIVIEMMHVFIRLRIHDETMNSKSCCFAVFPYGSTHIGSVGRVFESPGVVTHQQVVLLIYQEYPVAIG